MAKMTKTASLDKYSDDEDEAEADKHTFKDDEPQVKRREKA